MRRVENGLEMLDRPTPAAERAASLADVERLNARFGGDALTLRWVARVLAGLAAARPVRVLDVGAGGGPCAVSRSPATTGRARCGGATRRPRSARWRRRPGSRGSRCGAIPGWPASSRWGATAREL